MSPIDAFSGIDLEGRIVARAAACGIELPEAAADRLAAHARAVIAENDRLHLTTIVEPAAFLERHIGEAFEGAAMLDAAIDGELLDVGSGNGYPGLPVAACRPGLRPLLAEASARKAGFLRSVVEASFPGGEVIERQVQRPGDLSGRDPVRLLVTRAAGGWERWIPRMVSMLAPGGRILLWAGDGVSAVVGRAAWRKLRLQHRRALPGRDHSWIWSFEAA